MQARSRNQSLLGMWSTWLQRCAGITIYLKAAQNAARRSAPMLATIMVVRTVVHRTFAHTTDFVLSASSARNSYIDGDNFPLYIMIEIGY